MPTMLGRRTAADNRIRGSTVPGPSTAPGPARRSLLILQQIRLTGYSAHGDVSVRAEWIERFGEWLRNGAISFPHTRIEGIAQSPRALHDVLTGRHLGTVIVAV
jgi:NADPH-dependent curcumin reductase CurA